MSATLISLVEPRGELVPLASGDKVTGLLRYTRTKLISLNQRGLPGIMAEDESAISQGEFLRAGEARAASCCGVVRAIVGIIAGCRA